MHVRILDYDNWNDRQDDSTRVESPSWQEVEDSIRNLDGIHRTMAILAKSEDAYMIVGGQWDGLFLVNTTADNHDFFTMIDPEGAAEERLVYCGGQDCNFENRKLTPLAWVLKAAKTYFETGELEPSLNWESDC